MKNFFGFGATPEIEIILDGQDKRRTAEIKTEDGQKEKHLLYYDGETVSGKVKIGMKKPGGKFEHQGIRVELIGQIEFYYDRGTQYTFLSLFKELARPGDLLPHQQYTFDFHKVEKPYESYTGANCKLRYFIRVSIAKRLTDVVKERDFIVHTLSQYPDMNNSIKMEVGIEDCLHIEFEYNRSKYHLQGPNTFNENETIAKFEIMDGNPWKGESIPIRVFLAGYDLTPTFRDVNRKFSVRYYLNLVLVDEEDRRYFKQQEIILWRKIDKPRKTFQATLQQQYKEMQNPNAQFTTEPIPGSSSYFVDECLPEVKASEDLASESATTSERNNVEKTETSSVAMLEDVHQEDIPENNVQSANGNYNPNHFSSESNGQELVENNDNCNKDEEATEAVCDSEDKVTVATDVAATMMEIALDGDLDEA